MTKPSKFVPRLIILTSVFFSIGCGPGGTNGQPGLSQQSQGNPEEAIPEPPVFTEPGRDPRNYFVKDTKVGDLDNDGDLDFVSANWNSVLVWMNDGDGNFEDSGQSLGQSGLSLALGDIDGDGDSDVVVGNDGPNRIWLNNGNGVFSESPAEIGEEKTTCIVLGDMDGDLDLDIIVGDWTGSLWLNDGTGNFLESQSYDGPGDTVSLALGDLDNDGDLDLLIGKTGTNQILFNDGAGGMSLADPWGSYAYTNNKTASALLADIDGDGDLDVLDYREAGGNTVPSGYLWKNDGNGFFDHYDTLPASFEGDMAAFGDLDGDGDPDLIAGRSILINDGTGAFSDSGQSLVLWPTSLALGDLDGDHDPDLIAGGNYERIFENDGSGLFSHSDRLLPTNWSVSGIALANLDGDDDLDIVITTLFLEVWKNLAPDGFPEVPELSNGAGYYIMDMDLGDIDGDGDLDLALIQDTPYSSCVIFTNKGTGNLLSKIQVLGSFGGNPACLAFGDVDGDSDLDLVMGFSWGGNRLFLNDGFGGFSLSPVPQPSGGKSVFMDFHDLDNDGDLDLVEGNYGAPNRVWWNNGNGGFPESTPFGTGYTRTIAMGDLNGDGLPDIVEGNGSHGSWYHPAIDSSLLENRILINQGGGIFTDAGQSFGGKDTRTIALGDIDNDGDLDLVFGNYDVPSGVWWNNGSASFVDSGMQIGIGYTNAVALGDLDGDGDPDLVVGDYWFGTRIYWNE